MNNKKHRKIFPRFGSAVLLLAFSLSGCVNRPADNDHGDFDKRAAAKARVELALGYLNQQDLSQAKLNLDKALNYAPDYYLVHSALAYYYQRQGEPVQAKQAYLKAIALDGDQGDVHNNYGTFLCSQGEFDAAAQQFQAALAAPNYYRQADTYENAALCALAENNQARFRQTSEQLAKVAPGRAARLKTLVK